MDNKLQVKLVVWKQLWDGCVWTPTSRRQLRAATSNQTRLLQCTLIPLDSSSNTNAGLIHTQQHTMPFMYTTLRLVDWLTGSGAGDRKGKVCTQRHLPPGPEPQLAWGLPLPWGLPPSSPPVLEQALLLPPPASPLQQGKLLLLRLSSPHPSVPLQPWSEKRN